MTTYQLEGYNVMFDKEERKIVFTTKDKVPILEIKDMENILLLGKFSIDLFTEMYLDEVAKK